ncbi:MAG TPA: ATP-dependent 6-phosphofructokinase [Dehalococcoidia bacterium]|nr:ATP-dependent 6-phosphofructokinase [Dehalococcoidia bacterium]
MRIAVLTGGGDCPGLNAAIRAVAQRGWIMEDEVCGVHYGWSGLIGESEMHVLTPIEVRDILHESGTVLGTSRVNPGRSRESLDEVVGNLRRNAIDALVTIGGDDTLSVAAKLHEAGVAVVGIPKTIDNDIPGTDFCIGFDTATGVVADALDRLLSTAKSHARIMVVEVMGRDTGWLAVVGGLGGGADFIAIPEVPVHIDYIVEHARQRIAAHRFSVMAVAEGTHIQGLEVPSGHVDASDQFGHVRLSERGIAQRIADEVEHRTGVDTRVTVLGHLQRGGTPSVRDRYISTLMGSAAVDFMHRDVLGCMTALKGQEIVPVPLSEIAGKTWSVPPELYDLGRRYFRTMAALESPPVN